MTSKDLFEIIGQTKPEYRHQAVEALFAGELRKMEESQNMNRKTVWSAGRIALAAAVAALLLATAAVAANFLGVQTLLTGEKILDPSGAQQYELSLSQPQVVPEGFDPDTARTIENNQAAAAEWNEYCQSRPPVSDIAAEWEAAAPEGTKGILTSTAESLNENRDIWASALGQHPTAFALTVYLGADNEILGSRPITEEEWALHVEQTEASFAEAYAQYSDVYCGAYDIQSQADIDKLEGIAGKYGLSLLEESHAAQLSGEESILRDLPATFGEIVRYDEGSFAITCDTVLPSGQRAALRAYKSMYSTLAGIETRAFMSGAEKLSAQSYTAADGTELTVLSDSERAYVYVFLDDAFFTVSASAVTEEGSEASPLTQEDINYIADFFNYSLIGG